MQNDLISTSADSPSKVFVPWKFHPKDAIPEPGTMKYENIIYSITFLFRRPYTLQPQIEESYSLDISEEGYVLISIYHPLGVYRHSLRSASYSISIPILVKLHHHTHPTSHYLSKTYQYSNTEVSISTSQETSSLPQKSCGISKL